ncbi:MAG: FAD-dependent oxidoreductase [Rhodospirillales bacterium]
MSDHTYDLIVIGGGIAGMVAGTRAAERGLKVAILEKGEAPDYKCNTRWSGGIVHVGYVDPKEPAANIAAGIARNTRGYTDPALAQLLIDQTGKVIDWLRVQGVRFIRSGPLSYLAWTMAPPRALVAGMDWKGRGPDAMLRTLTERLKKLGGTLHLGVTAERLIVDDGRVAGVEAGSRRFLANAVAIADGGFQANRALIGQHMMPNPLAVKQRGAETGMGDGMRMAAEVGAAITGLDCFYGHLLSRDAMTNDKVWPYPELDGMALAGIVVNHTGQRFLDEGMGGVHMANTIARGSDPLCATLIMDTAIWEGPGRSARIPANPALERAGGTILRGNTLRELAGAAKLDPDGLEATVATYNAACASGNFDSLSPVRSTDKGKPMPIAKGPFVAIPACAGITYTMGGIRIDTDARVLTPDGTPVPGLYAAGATTGGIEGGPAIGYIGGLSKSAVLGFRAAEHAAGIK